ncbi:hypothetical protein D3C85_1655050 [compost metagenome]
MIDHHPPRHRRQVVTRLTQQAHQFQRLGGGEDAHESVLHQVRRPLRAAQAPAQPVLQPQVMVLIELAELGIGR